MEDILVNKGIITDLAGFRAASDQMKYYRAPMRAGRYEVKPNWNHIELIRHLRGGKQSPVMVVLTNERLLENVG
ncbi:MAG: hypothetical protein IPJ40_18025 [Saprospirales bacterium]|nr:hypothetical protein [Saprospirales bacterium]